MSYGGAYIAPEGGVWGLDLVWCVCGCLDILFLTAFGV